MTWFARRAGRATAAWDLATGRFVVTEADEETAVAAAAQVLVEVRRLELNRWDNPSAAERHGMDGPDDVRRTFVVRDRREGRASGACWRRPPDTSSTARWRRRSTGST